MKNLVIVESPAKAHTIEKYLGAGWTVLASVGHIRKDVKVDKTTFDVTYEIDPGHKKVVAELKKAAKAADQIWLATDEDREGEAISWHLLKVLNLPDDTRRITFHEITKTALENAVENPRTVDMDMVASQQARQTLDMLVGFDLSGVVRRKVPGAISAGRVQSPALRLVVEREREIEKFAGSSMFKVSGEFGKSSDRADEIDDAAEFFIANLNKDFPDEAAAADFLNNLVGANYTISDITNAPSKRSPAPPFTTATLQITANSRLGFSARTTMNAAQALYQAGLITYHRTDSVNLSKQAISQISSFVNDNFGVNYVKTRNFKTRDVSAQEAHEAIRPTNIAVESAGKNDYEQRLYQLIRARALATQMADATIERTTIKIQPQNVNIDFTKNYFEAKGEVVVFDGWLKAMHNFKENILPKLSSGDNLTAREIIARQNFARPPARYTEGALVKKLEELGIGRPSTYAGIMEAIQRRGYVVKGQSEGKNRDVIELKLENPPVASLASSLNRGRSRPLGQDMPRPDVGAAATSQSDNSISRQIVQEKSGADKGKLVPTPVGELISDFLLDNFPDVVDYKFTAGVENQLDQIAEAKLDRVEMLRDFYAPFSENVKKSEGAARYNAANSLGQDPKTGLNIYAKIGKRGGFIQLGENEKESGVKPRFVPLPNGKTVKTVTLDDALKQLALPALPRSLGKAKDGVELIAASGPFGAYLKCGKLNVQLKDADPYTIDLATAEQFYEAKKASIIADWGDVKIIRGAYGPYIKGAGRFNNVKIDKDQDPTKITETKAREMLA
ncbi:MAG: type I DNA topoisomerase, partial [Candidatus Nomurabacteria bacterium]|nr:type I DNA topoisomerase [Candidatus Nomurabacteria bacterium]